MASNAGTAVPSAGLVIFAIMYLMQGGQSQLPPPPAGEFVPAWTGIANIVLIVSNFLSYAGMEMNAVHVNDMDNPGKNFPKAILLSTIVILLIFILPTLAISVGVPASSVNLTQGVLQAFDVFFTQLGMPWGTTVMALLIVVGILASVVTWIPGPSRGLLLVGKEGYLPTWLQKTNGKGMQINIMFVQGIIVTILAIFFALSPSVQSVFWIFSAMAVQLYLIMYMVMFLAAMRLRKTKPDVVRGFRTPAMTLVGWVGFIASLLAFLIGFVEPTGTTINPLGYAMFLIVGIAVLGCGPFILYAIRKPSWRTVDASETVTAPAPAAVPPKVAASTK
ncbi:MAG: APC family permease [Caldilineaceae bacterium]